MKGIILAGGSGTRMGPLTRVCSKQLLPIYDKPVIYYPLCTLMQAGIREILIITAPQDLDRVESLLGDGSRWGISLYYDFQMEPKGIAQAFLIGERFINGKPCALILGDNLFYGASMGVFLKDVPGHKVGARIFAKRVSDPQRFGVVEMYGDGGVISLEEKPAKPRSNWAVTGLYLYDGTATTIAQGLELSDRGELEITDLNKMYLRRGQLAVTKLDDDCVWRDVGTPDALLEASWAVRLDQNWAGVPIGCPDTTAREMGWV